MSLVIRPAEMGDFSAVLPLLQQLWPKRPLVEEVMRRTYEAGLRSETRAYYVGVLPAGAKGDIGEVVAGGVVAGGVVAFGTLVWGENFWHSAFGAAVLEELVVHERARGHGIGAKMLEHIVEDAKTKGLELVELTSAAHRVEAHAFYEKRGFIRPGTQVFQRKL